MNAGFLHDANHIPIQWRGVTSSTTKTLTGNNTTTAVPIFTIQGKVEITGLYGDIATNLGNNTAAYWRTNDGSTQNNITLNTGTTLTGAVVGGIILKTATAASALTLVAGGQPKVTESGTAGAVVLQDFVINANANATSNIEFVYTTTDTPTTGSIKFYLRWVPLSSGGNVIPL